jgi:hypothetical protein
MNPRTTERPALLPSLPVLPLWPGFSWRNLGPTPQTVNPQRWYSATKSLSCRMLDIGVKRDSEHAQGHVKPCLTHSKSDSPRCRLQALSHLKARMALRDF